MRRLPRPLPTSLPALAAPLLAALAWASPALATPPAPGRSPAAPSGGGEAGRGRGSPEGDAFEGDEADAERPKSPDEGGSLLLALRPLAGNLGLADATFSGSGQPSGGGPREEVTFKGRDAGYATPFYYGAEAGLHFLIEHVSLGLVAGVGRVVESNAPTATASVASKVDGASAYFWGGALGLGGYVRLGPALVRAEIYGGARHFSVDLRGYQATACRTGRKPEYLCSEEVSSTQPLLQPRLSLDVAIVRKPGAGALVIGPWAGLELVPVRTLSAGLSVGITSSQ